MSISPAADPRVSVDFRFGLFVDAFHKTSSRVRYAAIIIVVASSILLAACWNSLPGSWVHARLQMTHEALALAQWCNGSSAVSSWEGRDFQISECSPEFATDNRVFKALRTPDAIEVRLAALDYAYSHNILLVGLPISGPVVEVNDLGAFTGVVLALLMLYLTLAVVHNYETLFLALWKVFKVAEAEKLPDEGDSDANLLYHAIAVMATFTSPPTLARSQPGKCKQWFPKILFLVPFAIQFLIVFHNWHTREIAEAYRPGYPAIGMTVQILTLAALLVLGTIAIIYARAGDVRWKKTFEYVNPRRSETAQPRWRRHVALTKKETQNIYKILSIEPGEPGEVT